VTSLVKIDLCTKTLDLEKQALCVRLKTLAEMFNRFENGRLTMDDAHSVLGDEKANHHAMD
jgi:hypothetical protein